MRNKTPQPLQGYKFWR